MELIDPCPTADIVLNQSQIQSRQYVLRDPEISQPWQASQLFFVDTLVDCGPISLDFYYDNAGKTPLDTNIFEDRRDMSTQNELIVKYNEDTSIKGSYAIKYKTYFTNYPDNFRELQNAIIMTIVNPCDAPVDVIPSVLSDMEYTITQAFFEYQIASYTADPAWCDISYSYSISTAQGDAAVTFDANTQKFTFFEPSNLSLSGASQTDYTVTVIGTTGNVSPVSKAASFNLKIRNPCIDPSYISLTSVALPDSESYILYSA